MKVSNRNAIQSRSLIKRIEPRQLLAFVATLSGTDSTFIDNAGDLVTIVREAN